MSEHAKPQAPDPSDPSNHGSEEEWENVGFFSEFLAFLKQNRKWWLAPLILLLLLIGGLLFLAGQHAALAPFIYTLF